MIDGFGPLPGDLRRIASAGLLQAASHQTLDAQEAVLVGGFSAERQDVGAGMQGASGPAEVDGPVCG
ncbi:hypothetical protein ADL00_00530 [Streptomyces sp. AS58]|nr:hypothetical protein [Streptomyces sp. AS58]KOV74824.1 hypothetical protein ADL00_00530 [Streptomyces sp. AS58]